MGSTTAILISIHIVVSIALIALIILNIGKRGRLTEI